ncbi:MAG: hypothetical protein WC666_02855 [Candidatus Paceibacterota bacterium]|jgi:ABC-type glucose/galactose transport system permease subunit
MKKFVTASIIIFSPLIAFAQVFPSVISNTLATSNTITDADSLGSKLAHLGNLAIYLLVGLAIIYIVWNVVMYIVKGDNPEDKSAAGLNVLWGIVGLFIIVSIWGLVGILTNTFRTNNNVPGRFPNADFINQQ